MTVEQKELIENNHNLIYDFAKKRNLFIDDYYDILAIGICKAAIIYDKNIGCFSTVAYKCMDSEIGMYKRYTNSQKRIPEEMIFSYDTPLPNGEDEETSFIDVISDNNDLIENIISDVSCSILLNMLNEKEKIIVEYLVSGLKQSEIAKILNTKQQNIAYIVKRIKEKWSVFVN